MAKIILSPIYSVLRLDLEKKSPDTIEVTAVFSTQENLTAQVPIEDLKELLDPNTPVCTHIDYEHSNIAKIIKPDQHRIIFCFHPSHDSENDVTVRLKDVTFALSQL